MKIHITCIQDKIGNYVIKMWQFYIYVRTVLHPNSLLTISKYSRKSLIRTSLIRTSVV